MQPYNSYKTILYNPKRQDYETHVLHIYHDELSQSPREWDNLSVIAAFSKDFNTNESSYDPREYDTWEEMEDAIIENEKPVFIAPLEFWDYGGGNVKMHLGNDTKDRHVIGFIYVTEERIKELCGNDPKYQERSWVEKQVKGELATFNQWLEGDVFGYQAYVYSTCPCCKQLKQEEEHSVWGFYGHNFDESGLLDDAGWRDITLNEMDGLERLFS